MSFLKTQTDAARATLAAMPMQSRVIVGLLIVAIGVGLAFLVRGNTTDTHVPIFGGRSLSESESAAMEIAFSAAGLSDWKPQGTRLLIPAETQADYYAALQGSATLPMSLTSAVEEALDKSSVFESTGMRTSREAHARERDLARQVMAMPEVRTATVFHSRGERSGLGRTAVQSALVNVQPVGTAPLSRMKTRVIASMIAAAFSGMSPDDVTVTDVNGTSSSLAEDEDPVLRKQTETETMVRQKVQTLLSAYPVSVAVHAEIDPSMNVQTTTLKYDAEPTTLASDSTKTESVTSTLSRGGEPGVTPNVTVNRATSLADATETRRTEEDQRATRAVTGQSFESRQSASLQVETITVSVGLPDSFYENLLVRQALRADPDADPTTINRNDPVQLQRLRTATEKEIQSAVAPLLPKVNSTVDPTTLVTVFHYPDPVEDPIAAPASTAAVMTWLSDSWQTLALLALGFVALLVARGAAKNVAPVPAEFNEAFGLELPTPPVPPETKTDETPDMDITGTRLQDELVHIVDNNPEVAANVIRGWIGEAA